MNPEFIFLSLFGAVFGGAGMFMMSRAWLDWQTYQQSEAWNTTAARVIESYVAESQSRRSSTYKAHVQYTYEAFGKTYTSDRITFGALGISTGSRSGPLKTVDQYPANACIMIYYNPDVPAEAVIERKFSWLGIGFSSVFVLIGLAIFGFLAYQILFG